MNIGIVTTWMERGAAYVSKNYMMLLEKKGHSVFIYARGGENRTKDDKWNGTNVFRGERNRNTVISKKNFYKWINKNNIEVIIFNEQKYYPILLDVKRDFSQIKICAYIDYYKEDTLPLFDIYDVVICNTKRHYHAMKSHAQRYYLKWGVDTELYKPHDYKNETITFFHSAGMSNRKGTDILIDTFISNRLGALSKLIIHTQIPIATFTNYSEVELAQNNIEVIEKTVTAPGLYYLGDVYVYPTTLDGLGLTLYEALSCGLPVITTDNPPMNEPIDDNVGRLVKVEEFHSRADGYYWPLSIVNSDDLANAMRYYIDNPEELQRAKEQARIHALNNYNIYDRADELDDIIRKSHIRKLDTEVEKRIIAYCANKRNGVLRQLFDENMILFRIKELLYWIKDLMR